MTTFSDMAFHLGGVPVNAPKMHTGKAFFVKPSSGNDAHSGRRPDRALKTLAKAHTLATADNGDVVYLICEDNSASGTTDYQSSALTWSKDGVHLIGIDGANGRIGGRSRIAQLSTTKDIETLVTVSASNCLIANIAIFHGVASSTATSPVALNVTGERNFFVNCHIQGNGDTGGSMDNAGARSLIVTGGENTFKDCLIGLDTVIRSTQTIEIEMENSGSGGGARNIFENCIMNTYTDSSDFHILSVGASDRFVILKDCMMIAAAGITSATAPNGAIDSESMNGRVLLHNTGVFGCTNVTTADDSKVLVMAPLPGVDAGLASSVDIA